MRVIAGAYKGRRLVAPAGEKTRPTADRVREALFNLLGPLDGETVLDLYAGSGSLGIEALSRGAAAATFVESDASALRALRSNLERLGIEVPRRGAGGPAHVVRSSVPAFLRSAARRDERWSVVVCDPPYRLAHRLGRELGELLPPVLDEEARVVCESSTRQPLELPMPLLSRRRYGDTALSVYGAAEASK